MSKLLLLGVLAIVAVLTGAIAEDCPTKAEFNGCFKDGCITVAMGGSKTKVVCNKCVEPLGYVLINKGTKAARCDCAPGYAGRSSMMICTKCPAEAQLAAGGPKATSRCWGCPPGTIPNAEAQDCMCPPGSFRVPAQQVQSAEKQVTYKGVACKPCTARTAYTDENNRARACATCPVPLVANTQHTRCVDMDDPDAAPLKAAATASTPNPLAGLLKKPVLDVNPNGPLADMVTDMQAKIGELGSSIQARLPGGRQPSDNSQFDSDS